MKKRIFSMLLCIAMLFSMSTVAFAVDNPTSAIDLTQSESLEPITGATLRQYPSTLSLTSDMVAANGIEQTISNNGIALLAENQAPVAALYTVVLNPESMVNGNFTTETQLAWLWSYNGVNYTYDPDGDLIADMRIGGISNSDIIGTITGDIGFATQFQAAGQYVLTFQVQDTNGAWSNVAQYAFIIESADGNTRPVCKIGYSSDTLIPGQLMLLSWANSTDSDAGDSIAGLGGMVIKDGVTTALSDYLVQLNADSCIISFDEAGTYELWVRVADNHNAWSNWVIFTVQVESVSLSGITVSGIYEPSSSSAWWVNDFDAKACDVAASWDGANYLFEHFGSHNFPSALPDKIVTDNSFAVSGQIVTASGDPVANTSVRITMPLSGGYGIDQTVLTDSNGNFSYNPTSAQFWVATGIYGNEDDIDFLYAGLSGTEYIRFSSSTGTNYLYPTTVYVTVGGRTFSENVTCEVGYSQTPIVGNLMYIQGEWYYL